MQQQAAAARIVTSAAVLLRLPTSTTLTTLAFLQGWHGARAAAQADGEEAATAALPDTPPARLAAACLFLATKAGPAAVTVRTNDLVNAVACVAADAGARPWAAVAGQPYATRKAALLHDEAVLLRALRFRVAPQADAALRCVLNAARLLGRGKSSTRGAVGLAVDAASLTTLPRTTGPVTTAAAALLVAGLASGEEEGEGGGGVQHLPPWWEALGVPTDGVLAAAEEMVAALERVAAEEGAGDVERRG